MEARRSQPLERLACNGCDRSFPSLDPEAMLAAIQGPCPDCGGHFELAKLPAEPPPDGTKRAPVSD